MFTHSLNTSNLSRDNENREKPLLIFMNVLRNFKFVIENLLLLWDGKYVTYSDELYYKNIQDNEFDKRQNPKEYDEALLMPNLETENK